MNSVWTDRPPGWQVYGPEQTQNAAEIYTYLTSHGVASNPAYAIIGNMQKESYLNPGQWELYRNYDIAYGFGLGQWTPSTKVSDVTGTGQAAMSDYRAQLDILLGNNPNQWSTRYVDTNNWSTYYNTNVPYFATFQDFLTDTTYPVDMLTKAYMACWERPAAATADIQSRIDYANHWAGSPPGPHPAINSVLILLLAKAALKWRL